MVTLPLLNREEIKLNKNKYIILLSIITILFSLFSPITNAADETSITIDSVVAQNDENSIDVPIKISGNTGICGAVISIQYDSRLTLINVEKGSALSSLTMTKPGNFSDNPVRLVWDGLEPDKTNGIAATLTFSAPKSAGVYDISISYTKGDIVDGELNPVAVHTENGSITRQGEEVKPTPAISVADVIAKQGEQVKVPINISGNIGICSATISIAYDSRLTLSNIQQGSALSSLSMTVPKDLSQNPFKLVWDGVEGDKSNGTAAILTFIAPQNTGIYDVSISYNNGDIVDGNLSPVDMKIKQGQIKVVSPKNIEVEVNGKRITMIGENESDNNIIAAFYNDNKQMISVKCYDDTDNIIKITDTENASFVKIMLWENLKTLRPLDKAQTVELN